MSRWFKPVVAGVLVAVGACSAAPAPVGHPVGAPAAVGGFDPLVRHARLGWLPPGLVQRSTLVQRGDEGGVTLEAGLPDQSTGATVTVTLLPAGVAPHAGCLPGLRGWPSVATRMTSAAPVHGRPALWITGAGGRDEQVDWLRWEYRDGAVAVARADDVDDAHTVLHRVAEGVALRDDERLAFPFAVAGLPGGMAPVAAAVVERSKSGWSGALVFGTAGYCLREDQPAPGALLVRVDAFVPGLGWGGGQSNTTVDGHPAFRQGDHLAVMDIPGPQVTLQAGDADVTARLGKDGLTELYRRVTVLGTRPVASPDEAPDLTTWTTDPVR